MVEWRFPIDEGLKEPLYRVHHHEGLNGQFSLQVTRLGIVHYTMKSLDKCLEQYHNPFKWRSFGEVTKAELVVHSKVSDKVLLL